MNADKLKELLDRIPMSLIMGAYLAYLGFLYYDFMNNPQSDLNQRKTQVETLKQEEVALKTKIKQANDFLKGLDAKKAELRRLAQQLDGMKGTLSESVDVAQLMKMTVTEAQRVGLTVVGLKPLEETKKELYGEHSFEFAFRGVFVQMLVFLDRLAQWQKIVRVDDFNMRPKTSSASRYVELEGNIVIRAYYYIGSKADDIGKNQGSGDAGAPKQPGSAGTGAAAGGSAPGQPGGGQ